MSTEKQMTMGQKFNVALTLCMILQRALVVPVRKGWGVRALGVPCALAFVLMILWAGLSRDGFMWAWVAIWLWGQVARRIESVRAVGIHTQYDGTSILCRNDKSAKFFLEPFLFFCLGGLLMTVYQENGWTPYGLPYFFMIGSVAIPFVEWVKHTVWQRRAEAMSDARIEQETIRVYERR